MEPTLRIRITIDDGTVIELEKAMAEAKRLLSLVLQEGWHDQSMSRHYPACSIRTVEVMPPYSLPGFSGN